MARMVNLIEIPTHKGCVLFLTPEEYARAVKRGKRIKRARQQAKREQEKWESEKQN